MQSITPQACRCIHQAWEGLLVLIRDCCRLDLIQSETETLKPAGFYWADNLSFSSSSFVFVLLLSPEISKKVHWKLLFCHHSKPSSLLISFNMVFIVPINGYLLVWSPMQCHLYWIHFTNILFCFHVLLSFSLLDQILCSVSLVKPCQNLDRMTIKGCN